MKQNNIPLSEYPRPQLVRDSYLCLNGSWEYAFSKNATIPDKFEGEIIVPFSPETKLSKVNKVLLPGEYLFYKKTLDLQGFELKTHVILNFLAVDQIAEVFVNKQFVGKRIGGFLPFSFDIKPYLKDSENEIVVRVQDTTNSSFYSSGKQSLKPEGIFYPPQSGIYLPVWLESTSDDYIKSIKITPDIDNSGVYIFAETKAKKVTLEFENRSIEIDGNKDYFLIVENPILWTPENPKLYDFKLSTKGDKVSSYFALRKVSLIDNEDGIKVLALNNEPYFMKGVLDQGYYKEGLLTPTCDEDYINDIKLIKELGFNTSRKHIKIESPRWYYYCDKLGLIVWQDFVNACTRPNFWLFQVPLFFPYKISDHRYKKFSRESLEGREQSIQEFKDTIEYLYNVPSICIWTIFNEGWGQFDSLEIWNNLKELDKTRLFDHASGFHDQGGGDFFSKHVYLKSIKMPNKYKLRKRAFICSECGAYILDEEEGKNNKKGLAYNVITNKKDFEDRYVKFINEDIIPNYKKGMSAFIYTQLSDVETEKNGFISYDRKKIKCDIKVIRNANDSIKK